MGVQRFLDSKGEAVDDRTILNGKHTKDKHPICLKDAPKGRVTAPLAITAAVSIFGSSFPHGWNTGVLNAPSHLIQDFLNETFTNRFNYEPSKGYLSLLWAISVSIYLVGGCGGAFSAGVMADKFGRKKSLLICHIFGFVAAILFGFCKMAQSFEMFILARIVVGFGAGAGSGLVPMYLTEIAPVNIRGAMGVLHQFALTCGIFTSQILGTRQVLGTEPLWPVLLAFTAIPCLVSLIVLPWFPDSPRYILSNKNDEKEAERALRIFRGTDDVFMDIQEMKLEQMQQAKEPKWSFKQLLKTKSLRTPLILVCSLACCQQLSGINVVFYYSTSVFTEAGIPADKAQYAVMGTGLINVIMTGISVPLMEKCGRRPLLLSGMIVMILSMVAITIALNLQATVQWMSYLSIVCTICFVIGFAIGLGSIPQFIGAELFKQGPRPPAMSIAGFANWFCNFAVAISFPSIQMALQAYTFILFLVIVLVFLIFLWWKLPETKNKSYTEIYNLFLEKKDEEATIKHTSSNGIAESESLLSPPSNGTTNGKPQGDITTKSSETSFTKNGLQIYLGDDSKKKNAV